MTETIQFVQDFFYSREILRDVAELLAHPILTPNDVLNCQPDVVRELADALGIATFTF